jgi:hypothetical protein
MSMIPKELVLSPVSYSGEKRRSIQSGAEKLAIRKPGRSLGFNGELNDMIITIHLIYTMTVSGRLDIFRGLSINERISCNAKSLSWVIQLANT